MSVAANYCNTRSQHSSPIAARRSRRHNRLQQRRCRFQHPDIAVVAHGRAESSSTHRWMQLWRSLFQHLALVATSRSPPSSTIEAPGVVGFNSACSRSYHTAHWLQHHSDRRAPLQVPHNAIRRTTAPPVATSPPSCSNIDGGRAISYTPRLRTGRGRTW